MKVTDFAELYRQLNDLDESPKIEAKRGTDVGHSMLESISAFCNEPGLGGGYLLLGVDADDDALPGLGGYRVCGISDPDRLQQNLVSAMNGQFNERLRLDIRSELFDGVPVVIVQVQETPPAQKPIYIKKDGLPRGAFRRIGSSDVACTEDDLAILFGGRGFKPHDGEPIPDADLADIDPDAIGSTVESGAV